MARNKQKKPGPGSDSVGEGPAESAAPSATAVAAEALRTGVMPLTDREPDGREQPRRRAAQGRRHRHQRHGKRHRGRRSPGRQRDHPDQDRVDDIGKALGVQEVDSGELRTTGELLDERDRKRALQDVPDPTTRG